MAVLMLAAASLSPGASCSHSGNIAPAQDKAAQSEYLPRIRWARAEARSASDEPLLVAVVRPQPFKRPPLAPLRAHRAQQAERAPSMEVRAVQHRIPQYGDTTPTTTGAMLQTFRDIRSELLGAMKHGTQVEKHELIHYERAVLNVIKRLRGLAEADSYEYPDEERKIRTDAMMLLNRLWLARGRFGQ